MGRGHTPFGYRVRDGRAVVDPGEAWQVGRVYAGYLSGMGYTAAAKETRRRRIQTRFKMARCEKELEDPYERAAYIYSLIESEE